MIISRRSWPTGLVLLFLCHYSKSESISLEPTPISILRDVLTGPLHERFAPFLDNVLTQISSANFFAMIDAIPPLDRPQSDEQWYEYIAHNTLAAKPILARHTAFYQLYALKAQCSTLSKQLQLLITHNEAAHVTTCMERGTPATYIASIRGHLSRLKHIIAVSDTQTITDGVKSFSLSVDLIVCTICLHHIPVEKLDACVHSLRDILKPGGLFLLRDHDVIDEETHKIVYTAHSVFNAVLANQNYRNIRTTMPECILEFEWSLPTQPSYYYAIIMVPVAELKAFIQLMNTQNHELLYIHDF